MKKKMIALSLSTILLVGCGASKVSTDQTIKPETEYQHHERILNGLLFSLITYAIFSTVKL
jgi:uncharacterized protein YcfL